MATGSTLCMAFIYIQYANRGISGRVINRVWGTVIIPGGCYLCCQRVGYPFEALYGH